MEWLVLVVLVPAILVPVVLLWGFAGCTFTVPISSDTQRPTNLRAKGISVSAIALTWDNPNTDPVTFQVERTKQGESIPQILASTSTTLDDTGLEEATSYFYQVRAIRLSDNDESDLSDQAPARTLGLVFQSALTTDQTGLEGFCLVQRIEPTRLRQSTLAGGLATLGARVRITLRGSTATNLILNRVFISQPAAAGDLYDSGGDLTHVASNVVVDANVSVPMPDIDYDLDHTKPLLIAFDISSAPGSGSVRFIANVPEAEAIVHFNPATAEAGINDRLPSVSNPGAPAYTPSKSIYLVEKIEVV
jgi:hypothetical protein